MERKLSNATAAWLGQAGPGPFGQEWSCLEDPFFWFSYIYRNSSESCSEIQFAYRWAEFPVQHDSYLSGSSCSDRSCQDSAVWARTAHGHRGTVPLAAVTAKQLLSHCHSVSAPTSPVPTASHMQEQEGQHGTHIPQAPQLAMTREELPKLV